MWRCGLIVGMVLGALGVSQGARASDAPTILVDRRADAVALYFALPAADLPPVFGQGADALLGAGGTIDIPTLYDGTFLLADRVFSSVDARIDRRDAGFEGLSLMVHDPDVLPEFASPYDAELAIAVCTSPETVRGLGLETLRAYMGFYAWKVDGFAPLSLEFAALDGAPMTFRVMEFVNFEPLPVREMVVPEDGRLTLAAVTRPDLRPSVATGGFLTLGAALALVIGFGVMFIRTRWAAPE